MRNYDSKIHLPGFDRFKLQFHIFFAETFFNSIDPNRRSGALKFRIAARPLT
jgi:hypothetical protein